MSGKGKGDSVDAIPSAASLPADDNAGTQAVDAVDGRPGGPSYLVDNYVDLEDSDFEYNMRHRGGRGTAIIINNERFMPSTQMSDRTGSSVDRDNLIQALKFVGFKDIIVRNNLSGKEMVRLLADAASQDYTDKDCLFISVLSHGDDMHLYGTDRPITYDILLEPLKAPQAHRSLIGKPKICVFQACRGEQLDSGAELQSDAAPSRRDSERYLISRESDFLLAYSVVPGYYSWRNCSNGSWFIQAFCEVMMRDGRRLELIQILTRVNRMVSYTFKSNASRLDMTDKKQSPCITSMLTKSLYFS